MASLRNLPTLVRQKFKSAQETKDLTFYQTRVSILQCDGIPFQLRYSPALANKPKSSKAANSKPFDPFETPPKGLFIADISPAYFLVLNKFPVIPDHFILATKEFKKQTDLLEEEDLEAAYQCLKAYRETGEELFGFFNSGEHSGASQPHRHLQFLPVQSMRSGMEEGSSWNVLSDVLVQNSKIGLPFTYFSSPYPPRPSPKQIHDVYLSLYEQACRMAKVPIPSLGTESPISYNLGMTDRGIVLCSRVSEGMKISDQEGRTIGPVSLNGTLLGGTLLVKSEKEWDALREDETKLAKILRAIGTPPANIEHDERL